MRFHEGTGEGSKDRLGGLPTHLPERFPRRKSHLGEEREELAFVAQFYCTSERLNLPNTLCIQLYQDQDAGDGGDPLPVAIRLPLGAKENTERAGLIHKGISQYHIVWEAKNDPDMIPEDDHLAAELVESKVGGTPYYTDDELPPGHIYLFQLHEDPAGLNFAGRHAIVTLAPSGELSLRLQ